MSKISLQPLNKTLASRPDLVLPLELVAAHIRLAEKKHPDWPTDPVYAAAIVSEEAGKLVRACNQIANADSNDIAATIEEAAHVATTAIRFLMHAHYPLRRCP